MEKRVSIIEMESVEISEMISYKVYNKEKNSEGGKQLEGSGTFETTITSKKDGEQRNACEGENGGGDEGIEGENEPTIEDEADLGLVTGKIYSSDEDEDDVVLASSSSSEDEESPEPLETPPNPPEDPAPEAVPKDTPPAASPLNYLEYRLPKSKENRKFTEKSVQEGTETVLALKALHAQLKDQPDKDVRIQGPSQLKVRLLDHQQHALAWMLWRESSTPAGGILADDLGLGKTVTTISLILKSLEDDSRHVAADVRINPGGTLVVCPANLIPQWKQELETKGGISEINIYHKEEERDISVLGRYQVVITSYEALSSNHTRDKILFKIHWRRVVLDEAHVIRNPNSRKSQCVTDLVGDKRWALTGTPIHNHVKDIFAIVRFLELVPFDDPRVFNKWIANNDPAGVARLHCIMEVLMLRRTKVDLVADGLMPELPRKTSRSIEIELTPEEREIYEKVLKYSQTLYSHFLHQKKQEGTGEELGAGDHLEMFQLTSAQKNYLKRQGRVPPHKILTLILRLRQMCCHPALIKDLLKKKDFRGAGVVPADHVLDDANRELLGDVVEFHGEDKQEMKDAQVVTSDNPVFNENFESSKLKAIVKIVQEIIEKRERVIIASDWVKYLNIIGQHLEKIPGATFEFYTGGVGHEERARIAEKFNNSEDIMILLVSMGAIGQGLDLKGANHVIIADVHWNPQMEVQAQDLVYRMGQTKDVVVYKFVCKGTIEESIVELQGRKLTIAGVVLKGSGHGVRELDHDEMGALFKV